MKQKICSIIFSTALDEDSCLALGAGLPRFMIQFGGRYTYLDFFLSAFRRLGSEIDFVVASRQAEFVHTYMERSWGETGWDILPFIEEGSEAPLNRNMIQAFKSMLRPWVLLARADSPVYADLAPLLSKIKRRTQALIPLINKKPAPVVLIERGAFLDYLGELLKKKTRALDVLPALHRHFSRHPKTVQVELAGFLPRITNIDQYIAANYSILQRLDEFNRFFANTPLHSGLHEKLPAVIERGGEVYNSMLADDAHVYGTVHNSILFPGVVIGRGAVVRDSVILSNVIVGHGAQLTRTLVGPGGDLPQNTKFHIGEECRIGKPDTGPVPEKAPLTCGFTFIASGALVPRGVTIGANCYLGPSVDRTFFRRAKNISDGRHLN